MTYKLLLLSLACLVLASAQACEKPCTTCNGAPDVCAFCIDGYVLNTVTKKWLPVPKCPIGQIPNAVNVCTFICGPGKYFLNSVCYEAACPDGYVGDSTNRVCVGVTIPGGCPAPMLRQGSSCVLACSLGYYTNVDTLTCDPCPPNCLACDKTLTCSKC